MDIDNCLQLLEKNTTDVLIFIGNLTHTDPLYQPAKGWNGMQILEHVCLTDSLISEMIAEHPEGIADKVNFFGEQRLEQLLTQDKTPLKSPVFLIPRNKIHTREEFYEGFIKVRDQLKRSVISNKHLDNKRFYHNPLIGDMTVSDWLLYIVFHTRRHMKQLEKLIAIRYAQ